MLRSHTIIFRIVINIDILILKESFIYLVLSACLVLSQTQTLHPHMHARCTAEGGYNIQRDGGKRKRKALIEIWHTRYCKRSNAPRAEI